MNKAFISKDDEALIIDEEDNEKEVIPNYNNLKETLETESIIEWLENKKSELTKYLNNHKRRNIKKETIYMFVFCLLSTIIATNIVPLLLIDFKDVLEAINYLKVFNKGGLIIGFIFGGLMTFNIQIQNKGLNDIINGKEIELDFLNKELTKEQEHIEKLKQDRQIIETEKITYTALDTKEKLKSLKELLESYYCFGYNETKYYELYLNNALNKKYNEETCTFIKEYFEEKGQTLKKTRK